MQNPRLEPTGRAKPGETRKLTGVGPDLARHEAAGLVFCRVLNTTDPCLWYKPGLWAGYPDPLLTLGIASKKRYSHVRPLCGGKMIILEDTVAHLHCVICV